MFLYEYTYRMGKKIIIKTVRGSPFRLVSLRTTQIVVRLYIVYYMMYLLFIYSFSIALVFRLTWELAKNPLKWYFSIENRTDRVPTTIFRYSHNRVTELVKRNNEWSKRKSLRAEFENIHLFRYFEIHTILAGQCASSSIFDKINIYV